MKLLTIALLLIASTVYGADQKTLDFCHEYIGEAIKQKDNRGIYADPNEGLRYMIPVPQSQLKELVQPLYRGDRAIFNNISASQREILK